MTQIDAFLNHDVKPLTKLHILIYGLAVKNAIKSYLPTYAACKEYFSNRIIHTRCGFIRKINTTKYRGVAKGANLSLSTYGS